MTEQRSSSLTRGWTRAAAMMVGVLLLLASVAAAILAIGDERPGTLALLAMTFAGVFVAVGGAAYGLWNHRLADAQQKLREREQRFRWHAERAGDLMYRYRLLPEPRVEYVNPASERIVGYAPAEYYADPDLVWRTVHPDDRPILEAAVADPACMDREPLLLRWIRKDGGVTWMEQRNTMVRDATGALVGIEGIAREVTARQELERELREARDRLLLALHVARQSTFDVDLEAGRVLLSTTRSGAGGLRARNRAMPLRAAMDRIHPEDRERMNGMLADLRSGAAESSEAEFRIRTDAGGTRWSRTVARVVVRADDGEALRIVGIHSDITARRLAEAELEESQERYSALQEQMLHAQKMEAVGRLAGGIAHDFNNVLTSIRGHALLALEDLPPGWPSRGDLDEVVRDADRAAALTRQLLAFSRKQVLDLRVFDLGAVVADMEPMIRRLIGEDIRLVVERRDCPCPVRADPARMEQVLLNLVVNARDAMPHGGRLTIAIQHRNENGPEVVLRVVDTGTGMDPATVERIFEPFFTTKAEGKGTGLGLSTVYGIVRQCGGEIGVDSAVGLGTTFSLVLPRVAAATEAELMPVADRAPGSRADDSGAHPAPHPTPAAANGTGHGVGARILVVEDEAAVLALTRRVLEKAGYAVTAAGCPEEALRLVNGGEPGLSLLVTDIVLPGIGGPALAARLAPHHAGLRILLMSGYPESVVRGQHSLPEDALFLEKPFTPDQLLARVEAALGHGPPARA